MWPRRSGASASPLPRWTRGNAPCAQAVLPTRCRGREPARPDSYAAGSPRSWSPSGWWRPRRSSWECVTSTRPPSGICCPTRSRGWRSAASQRPRCPSPGAAPCSRASPPPSGSATPKCGITTAAILSASPTVRRHPVAGTVHPSVPNSTTCDRHRRASAGGRPAPRIPPLAGRALRRRRGARPRLRTPRRSPATRQHP